MKTFVYVDGFNLYHRALRKTRHKWLDLHALAQAVLPAGTTVQRINYYTADVSSKVSPQAPRNQFMYLKALKTIPHLKIHKGRFRASEVMAFLAQPPEFQPTARILPDPPARFAKIVKLEEKGTDVNLGCTSYEMHLSGRLNRLQSSLMTRIFQKQCALWCRKRACP